MHLLEIHILKSKKGRKKRMKRIRLNSLLHILKEKGKKKIMKGSDWIQSCWNRKLSFSFCLLIKKPDFLLKYLKSQFWFELTWVRAGPGLGSERKDEPSTVLIAPKILWKRQLQRERERERYGKSSCGSDCEFVGHFSLYPC